MLEPRLVAAASRGQLAGCGDERFNKGKIDVYRSREPRNAVRLED